MVLVTAGAARAVEAMAAGLEEVAKVDGVREEAREAAETVAGMEVVERAEARAAEAKEAETVAAETGEGRAGAERAAETAVVAMAAAMAAAAMAVEMGAGAKAAG